MSPIHRLTGLPGDLGQSTVACGAVDASVATWDAARVTCAACQRAGRCPPARPAARPSGPFPTEKACQEAVRRLARAQGWLYYHVHEARHSPPGYPDLTLVRGARLIFGELKMPGKTPTPAQQRWLDALGQVTQVETYLWTTDAWPAITERLR